MSDQSHGHSDITLFQKIFAVFGGIAVPLFVLYTLLQPAVVPQSTDAEIEKRIKPLAMVEVRKDTGPHVDKSGEEVVKGGCAACHAAGALGSPKLGDKAAWAPRIAQGYQALIKHAIEGIRAMPPRGGNDELSDHEIADAVAYMANQAGAKFTAPKPAPAAAAPAADAAAPAATPAPTAAK